MCAGDVRVVQVKRLQVIVMGLAKGLSSVSYIMILMFLIFYLFAVCSSLFHPHTRMLYISLSPLRMLSLFTHSCLPTPLTCLSPVL